MIVLDTHAWFWWVNAHERLGRAARGAIEEADSVGVPSVCCWELARLAELGRLQFERGVDAWLRAALGHERAVSLPLDAETAVAAARLDRKRFPSDPADRFIYATAVQHGARLATADTAISAFDPARTIWK
ncbi:MAG: type II toxin-antitoxin system VapC family toxin [Solirubrobacterales bacterium]